MKKQNNHSRIYKIDGVGIDLNRFSPANDLKKQELRKELGFEEHDFIILNVAEINHNKNQIMLLKSIPELLKIMPNLRIIFAGKENISEPRNFVVNNNYENIVTFLGYRKDVDKFFAIADVVFSASQREGQGVNLVEGMAMSKPIVASNIRGHKDVINQFVNGFLFDLKNPKSLEDAILILYNNPALRKEIGERNIIASKQYSVDIALEKMGKIYSELIKDDNTGGGEQV